jgi:ribosomal protein L16 Arg81 hydroxylase
MSAIQNKIETPEKINDWFNQFISEIKVDQMMIETNTAPAEKKEFYTNAMTGNVLGIFSSMRLESTKFYISQIVNDYFKELHENKANPQKLAFDLSDAKILVWAQIQNQDESTERALILSEAEANSKYSDNGFYISSTIVEDCDNLPVPPHYKEVNINGRRSISY